MAQQSLKELVYIQEDMVDEVERFLKLDWTAIKILSLQSFMMVLSSLVVPKQVRFLDMIRDPYS